MKKGKLGVLLWIFANKMEWEDTVKWNSTEIEEKLRVPQLNWSVRFSRNGGILNLSSIFAKPYTLV